MIFTINVLVVDDESLARQRMRTLLEELVEFPLRVLEAAAAVQAKEILQRTGGNAPVDVVFLDIQMPGMDGMQFAQLLRNMPKPPAIVFVTAHAEYASQAFDLEATDYLTKPVRLERLRQALKRVLAQRHMPIAHETPAPVLTPPSQPLPDADAPFVIVNERNRTERVLVDSILFCRAEMKYVTLQVTNRQYLYDGSLNELESRFPDHFLRVHRNALVTRKALRGLVKAHSAEDGEHWRLQLHGTNETLQVSRRMLPTVRAVLHGRE